MKVNYNLQHAAEWARFSGDYNPIHFDAEMANAAGLGGLSVHGMRALLDMKIALSQGVEIQPENSVSYRFNARLREAIKCHTEYQLHCIDGQSQLDEADTGRCCFSGKLKQLPVPEIETAPLTQRISPHEVMSLHKECPGGDEMPQWCFLDALLFRQMIHAPEILASVKETLPQLKAKTLAEVFSQLRVVQTHHEVFFSSDLLGGCQSLPKNECFQYGVLPPLIMGDAEKGLVIRLAMHGGYPSHSQITTVSTLKLWSLTL